MSEIYLTAAKAFNLIQDGKSIVSCSGYKLYKNGYFAYGTYPECIRAGNITLEGMMGISNSWKVMTDYDIVMYCGYQEPNCCAYQLIREDGTVNFKSLNKFLEENLTVKDYKDSEKNKRMVAEALDDSYVRECKKNKELQKRIDLIVDLVRDNTPDYWLDNMIQDILKGETMSNQVNGCFVGSSVGKLIPEGRKFKEYVLLINEQQGLREIQRVLESLGYVALHNIEDDGTHYIVCTHSNGTYGTVQVLGGLITLDELDKNTQKN